jgi:hypothetical protein
LANPHYSHQELSAKSAPTPTDCSSGHDSKLRLWRLLPPRRRRRRLVEDPQVATAVMTGEGLKPIIADIDGSRSNVSRRSMSSP